MQILRFAPLYVALVVNLCANQEAYVPLSRFHLESDGIGSSGKIIVEGREDIKGAVSDLTITAFGKEHVLPKDLLGRLQGLRANGIRITYDSGIFGGSMHVLFQMGSVSHTTRQMLVTVRPGGGLTVDDVPLKTG